MPPFTRYEETILEALRAKEGEAVSREDIYKALYPDGMQLPTSNSLEVIMRRIRIKLGETGTIETVRGVGYRLIQVKKPALLSCGNAWCGVALPGPYGTPGVSLARADNKTLLCSNCGTAEALGNVASYQR